MHLPWRPLPALVLFCFFEMPCFAMTQSEFIQKVKISNPELNGLAKIYEARKSLDQSRVAYYDAAFFAEAGTLQDQKVQTASAFTYDKLTVNSYQLGIEKVFEFGLQSRFFYKSNQTEIANGAAGTSTFNLNIWESSPGIELRLPLLSNSLGKQFRVSDQLQSTRSELELLQADFNLDQKTIEARMDFLNAQITQDQLKVQLSALSRVTDIYALIKRKAERNLEQESNLLQTRAVVELTRIEFSTTQIKADLAMEKLAKWLDSKEIGIPAPYDFTEIISFDPKKFQLKKTTPSLILQTSYALDALASEIELDKQKSELDLIANHSLNGTNDSLNSSMDRAHRGLNPTTYIGLRFRSPLDFSKREQRSIANQMISDAQSKRTTYQGSLSIRDFAELSATFQRTKDLLQMSFSLEKAQQEKLKNEKKLLSQGRSSIYQVLQFELDYTRSQSAKYQYIMELESLKNQIQLYKY